MTRTVPPIPIKPSRPKPPVEAKRPPLDAGFGEYKPRGSVSGVLRCVQSDTTNGTLERWVEGFTRHHPAVEIVDWVCGSAAPAAALSDGWADFGFVAREMLPREADLFAAKTGHEPTRIAVCGGSYRALGFSDALGVIVHPSNPLRSITLPQLDALYSTSRRRGHAPIATWGDLGLDGKWADRRINLWGVRAQNGFEQFVKERVLLDGEYKNDLELAELIFPIADNVAADVAALGYTGLAYLTDGVKVLDLEPEDTGRPVPASIEEVASQHYPLARSIYIFSSAQPGAPVDPALDEFVRYVLSREGQQAVYDEGTFLPLPVGLARSEANRLTR